jgi:hypothetical protein
VKAVALFLVWGGFVGIAWGANRISNGCVTLRTVAWPQGGTITDPCSGTSSSASSSANPGNPNNPASPAAKSVKTSLQTNVVQRSAASGVDVGKS